MNRSPKGNNRKRSGRSKYQRSQQSRPERKTVLIVCEGQETEPNYFRGLKILDGVKKLFHVIVRKGRGEGVSKLVEIAAQLEAKDDYDSVWCVIDTEVPANDGERKSLLDAVKLAATKKVNLALSNPAFEVWLLAHFKRTSQSFGSSRAASDELNIHWERSFQKSYRKNADDIFSLLNDRVAKAIDNASEVRNSDHRGKSSIIECNSSTDVFKLAKMLTTDNE
jgi:hypothetical protein